MFHVLLLYFSSYCSKSILTATSKTNDRFYSCYIICLTWFFGCCVHVTLAVLDFQILEIINFLLTAVSMNCWQLGSYAKKSFQKGVSNQHMAFKNILEMFANFWNLVIILKYILSQVSCSVS
eukprot:TRINITY_DN2584_c0_g1_i2.p2 TRINITY_DN2584_c0_g1~~TRINITY_DN2584_c0_g1_i2.p2  ORF type:complete len:122 (+),score=3.23 TRINITY_DN2584_c0_g1_i2:98-463(+)